MHHIHTEPSIYSIHIYMVDERDIRFCVTYCAKIIYTYCGVAHTVVSFIYVQSIPCTYVYRKSTLL